MPLAEQKLKEKLHFDVYAMMNILGFLALCGAIWFIHDHLIIHWYGGEGGTDDKGQPLMKPKAENLTKINRLHEAIYLQETDELVKLGYDSSKSEKELSVEVQVTE